MESFSKYDLRVLIKFFFLQNLNNNEIHLKLTDILGSHAPSISTIKYWTQKFRTGNFKIESEPKSGRPNETEGSNLLYDIQKIIEEEPKISCRQIAMKVSYSMTKAHR